MLGGTLTYNRAMIAHTLTSFICFSLLSLLAANCSVL